MNRVNNIEIVQVNDEVLTSFRWLSICSLTRLKPAIYWIRELSIRSNHVKDFTLQNLRIYREEKDLCKSTTSLCSSSSSFQSLKISKEIFKRAKVILININSRSFAMFASRDRSSLRSKLIRVLELFFTDRPSKYVLYASIRIVSHDRSPLIPLTHYAIILIKERSMKRDRSLSRLRYQTPWCSRARASRWKLGWEKSTGEREGGRGEIVGR